MKEYLLDDRYIACAKTVSKGSSLKYYRDGYYYKVNSVGNEGFCEYLVSRVLSYSSIPNNLFVYYNYCRINGLLGCRSKSFLDRDEDFITMEKVYQNLGGSRLADQLMYLPNASERLDFILGLVGRYVNVKHYRNYLGTLLQLDLLILNTDRHTSNYGIIFNASTGKCRIPPIFDNGMSLDTNRTGCKVSCTISGSFEDQVVTFGYPVKPYFTIDYKGLYEDLYRIQKTYGYHREIDILKSRLEQYSYLFKR